MDNESSAVEVSKIRRQKYKNGRLNVETFEIPGGGISYNCNYVAPLGLMTNSIQLVSSKVETTRQKYLVISI